MFYLYGKHICNCKWKFIGYFNKEDAEKFMDENENTDDNPLGCYISFYLSLELIEV